MYALSSTIRSLLVKAEETYGAQDFAIRKRRLMKRERRSLSSKGRPTLN